MRAMTPRRFAPAVLVTFALLILGVNGVDREVFESRLPLLVIPLGMVLVAARAAATQKARTLPCP